MSTIVSPLPNAPQASAGAEANLAAALIAAQRAGGLSTQRVAVVDDAGAWTASELESATARAAGALRARGLEHGDRVAIALPPGRAWLQAFLGIVHAGGIAVPVDPDGPGRAIGAYLEEVGIAAVVTDRAVPAPAVLIHPRELDRGSRAAVAPVAGDDCAFLIATSGSTGRPKGVMHAHGPSVRPGYVRSVLAVGPDDRVLSASAGFSALGLFIGILRPLASGACVVLSARRPTPRSIIAAVASGGVTVLSAVPTLWAQIAAFLERRPEHAAPIARLRHAVASGEPLAASVAQRLWKTTGTALLDGYGSAECGDIVIGHRPGQHADGLG
ncbi:MAG TPA: AMP-binding protein, partial [Miltoncostaeaceae bacterium]|nr:AMP-binding protein [Miltoncostaeaceae bacterium]